MSFDSLFDQIKNKKTNQSKSKEDDDFDSLFEHVHATAPSRSRSLISAPIKGLIKGAASFSPLPNLGPISLEGGKKITEQMLPTQDNALEDVLEFAGENIPTVAMGSGGLLRKGAQSLAGGLAKKGAKEFDLPEWAQELIGGVGMASPDVLKSGISKALRPSSKQASIVDFLKSKGFSDKDITPIIQDSKMVSLLSKGANKFEKKEPWLKGIKDNLGNIYEDIREKGKQSGYLQGKGLQKFEDEFYNQLEKVPKRHQKLIKSEVEDLFNNPIDFTELHDFSEAVNDIVKGTTKGKAVVGIMKKPIYDAQKGLNPELFGELKKTDLAYSKLANFTDKMTKKNWEGLVKLGQAGAALWGVLTLDPSLMIKGSVAAGATALGRESLKQALTNPRLQNIHLKMWDAFLKNKIPQSMKLLQIFNQEIERKNASNSELSNTQ